MDQPSSEIPGSNNEAEFDDLLRTAKMDVPLPHTFQVEVWRRIAVANEASLSARFSRGLEGIIAVVVRPLAATMAVLMMGFAGMLFGSIGGHRVHDGKSAYVESVSPFVHLDQEGDR